ncbi:MAG: hypothetical protein DIU68_017785 [Chloroflexota bacterium]|nr:MAG: hypothetical protein DIU68_18870 [Chloroflexota bacterium]
MATGQQLQYVYELIRSGHREHAANLLTVLLVTDPQNADAWWLLALAAPTAEIMRRALCRVLELRPDDTRARHLLDSLNVRQVRAEGRAAALQRQHAPLPAFPAYDSASRRPALRRRDSDRISIFRQRRSTGFFVAFAMAILFGLAGCGLMVVAVASGVQLVGRALAGFQLPVAAPVFELETQTNLGDINSLGNTGYAQFRDGALGSAAERHAYTFTGRTGDIVIVEVTTPDSSLDPAIALYAPDGRLIAASRATNDVDARLNTTLPLDGMYTIVVSSQGTTGSYRLSLRH